MNIQPINSYNSISYFPRQPQYRSSPGANVSFQSYKIIGIIAHNTKNPIKAYAQDVFKRSLIASARTISSTIPELKPITKEVNLKISDKETTYAWDIQNKNSKKYVIYMHGASQNITNIQNLYKNIIENTDFSILAPEYRGFGKNKTGKVNSKTLLEDARAALKYLKEEKQIKEKDIVVIGHSMGAYPAVLLTNKEPKLGRLMLVSPIGSVAKQPLDINVWFAKRMPPLVKFLFKNFKVLRTSLSDFFQIETLVKKIKMPIDIIHAQNDRLIKYTSSEALANNCQKLNSLTILKQGGHKMETNKINTIISLLSS